MTTTPKPLRPNDRYPVQYHCTHQYGHGPFRKSDGHPNGRGGLTCPTCRFGDLARSMWNGIAWH